MSSHIWSYVLFIWKIAWWHSKLVDEEFQFIYSRLEIWIKKRFSSLWNAIGAQYYRIGIFFPPANNFIWLGWCGCDFVVAVHLKIVRILNICSRDYRSHLIRRFFLGEIVSSWSVRAVTKYAHSMPRKLHFDALDTGWVCGEGKWNFHVILFGNCFAVGIYCFFQLPNPNAMRSNARHKNAV